MKETENPTKTPDKEMKQTGFGGLLPSKAQSQKRGNYFTFFIF